MSSLALPIPTAAPAATTATTSSPAPRSRDAQAASGGDSFGAALARTRDSRSRQSDDKAESTSGTPATRRRALAADESQDGRKESTPAELLAMALLTPAFNAQATQQRHAAAQAGDSPLRTAVDAGKATAPDQPLADVTATATSADALPGDEAVDSAGMQAGAQAARARSDSKDADAKPSKAARAEPAASTADVKSAAASPAAAVVPATGALPASPAAGGGSQAGEKPGASAASTAASGAGARSAPVPAATGTQAREPSLADSIESSAADTPAPSPAALNFKAALAEATTGSSSTAQAQHVPRLAVPSPVGSENWGADIGTQMVRMSSDGHHVAELSLNPAGLGPLKVTLTLGDSQAQAQFVSAHESVRRAVEAALPQLRDTLASQGIQLGQASVNAGTQQQQQQQAFAQQQQQQERAFDGPAQPASRTQQAATDTAVQPERAASASRSRSAIDTFA